MLILTEKQVRSLLDDDDSVVLDVVRQTYVRHAAGKTVVPHSVFLRFGDDDRNRIIGLPAWVGGEEQAAGFKWVASFPGNLARNMPRASAVMTLNSTRTGQPEAFLAASAISARRTGASAALAAGVLAPDGVDRVLLVGCGVINFEVLRYLTSTCPDLRQVALYDQDPGRAEVFGVRVEQAWPRLRCRTEDDLGAAMGRHDLVSLATTATRPHMDASACRPGSVVLHVSLRDLTANSILGSRNVVDDADHVCRAGTSIHLAEQQVDNRDFIGPSIGELLADGARHADPAAVTVVSPFGLGALDVALAAEVCAQARAKGLGTWIDGFLS